MSISHSALQRPSSGRVDSTLTSVARLAPTITIGTPLSGTLPIEHAGSQPNGCGPTYQTHAAIALMIAMSQHHLALQNDSSFAESNRLSIYSSDRMLM